MLDEDYVGVGKGWAGRYPSPTGVEPQPLSENSKAVPAEESKEVNCSRGLLT